MADTALDKLNEGEKARQPADMSSSKRKHLSRLEAWLQTERDRQSENRYQMALDEDFYDGIQWSEDDAKAVEERGQAPLVFNETKVAMDWILGSEKRNRVDWSVLPRTEDDVKLAEVKTAVMKYVSDSNRIPFVRSGAFKEAVVSGLGWLEDTLNDDATEDILYSGSESWRNILHDSFNRSPTREGRYIFRWRDIDLDIAISMFPKHAGALRRAAKGEDELAAEDDNNLWYLGDPLRDRESAGIGRRSYISDAVRNAYTQRQRVRLYECWYRVPEKVQIMDGAFGGEVYQPEFPGHQAAVDEGKAELIGSTTLVVRCSYFVDGYLLDDFRSPFKHNKFPFTAIYAFRRGRDGLPYGFVRNIRDPQSDLNKRMSKALFIASANQIITESGAFDEKGEYTIDDAVDAANRPNGVIVMRDGGKRFEFRKDLPELQAQTSFVQMDKAAIQSGSGVTDELLGRRTNATSGVAIEARQDQGSLTTNGVFDNYRLAISISGQKQLSNAEQFYTKPKVVRLSGQEGFEWVRINQPEMQPDGSVRFMNDIASNSADFIVDEQDFKASMRQAMFDSLNEMIGHIAPLNPTFAMSMLDLLVEVADFPGKEKMLERLKTLIAEARGELPKTPEQQQMEAEAAELERQAVASKIAKDQASAAKDDAAAQKALAEADKTDAEADVIRSTLLVQGALAVDLARQGVSPAEAGVAAHAAVNSPGSVLPPPVDPNVPNPGTIVPNSGTTPAPQSAAPAGAEPASYQPTPAAADPMTAIAESLAQSQADMVLIAERLAQVSEATAKALQGVAAALAANTGAKDG